MFRLTSIPAAARLRRAATFANVVSVLALFTALGGSAYAAATIGTAQIIDDSVRSIDVRNGTLASTDYGDGSVRSSDIRNGGVQSIDLAPGALDSVRTRFRVEGTATALAGGAHGSTQVLCDYEHGELASGGGGYSYYAGKGMLTGSSVVYGTGEYENMPIGWEIKMQNLQGTQNFMIVRAICAKG